MAKNGFYQAPLNTPYFAFRQTTINPAITNYASKAGNDANSGTSIALPKKTIITAVSTWTLTGTGMYRQGITTPVNNSCGMIGDGLVVIDATGIAAGTAAIDISITNSTSAYLAAQSITFTNWNSIGGYACRIGVCTNAPSLYLKSNQFIDSNLIFTAAYANGITSVLIQRNLFLRSNISIINTIGVGYRSIDNNTFITSNLEFTDPAADTLKKTWTLTNDYFHTDCGIKMTQSFNDTYFLGFQNCNVRGTVTVAATVYANLAAYFVAYPAKNLGNNISSDPLFNSETKDDYTLQAASPNANAGIYPGEDIGAFPVAKMHYSDAPATNNPFLNTVVTNSNTLYDSTDKDYEITAGTSGTVTSKIFDEGGIRELTNLRIVAQQSLFDDAGNDQTIIRVNNPDASNLLSEYKITIVDYTQLANKTVTIVHNNGTATATTILTGGVDFAVITSNNATATALGVALTTAFAATVTNVVATNTVSIDANTRLIHSITLSDNTNMTVQRAYQTNPAHLTFELRASTTDNTLATSTWYTHNMFCPIWLFNYGTEFYGTGDYRNAGFKGTQQKVRGRYWQVRFTLRNDGREG